MNGFEEGLVDKATEDILALHQIPVTLRFNIHSRAVLPATLLAAR